MSATVSIFSKTIVVQLYLLRMNPSVFLLLLLSLGTMSACKSSKVVSAEKVSRLLEKDSLLDNAHVGISVYDVSSKKFLYQYQSDKYFVPASNIKILSCYVGMKYLDSLIDGVKWIDLDTAILLIPTGDPTFLHPDFAEQPVVKFLQQEKRPVYIDASLWMSEIFGLGWSWDDYNEYYMVERSALPAFGNVIRWHQSVSKKENPQHAADTVDRFIYSDPEVNWPVNFAGSGKAGVFSVTRNINRNEFTLNEGGWTDVSLDVPYITSGIQSALELIKDTVHHEISALENSSAFQSSGQDKISHTIKSQRTDTLLKIMMHRSDNFFAEQILLMSAVNKIGVMSDRQMIQEMLNNDLRDFPQSPRWVDGSGLSRYNLFTPDDFVWLLQKMKDEFGMERIAAIFPSGGMGTLTWFTAGMHNRVIAKSGSLSGVLALSGYLNARSGKPIIFSILINNFRSSPALLRKRIEKYLMELSGQH